MLYTDQKTNQKTNIMRIPEELKRLPQWVRWQLEKDAAGSFVKVPYTIYPTQKANVTNPETWTIYNVITQVSEKIGFVFSEEDPYTFIDMDNILTPTGQVKTELLEIIDKLKGCGALLEVSQSGQGVHAIVRGVAPKNGKISKNVEVYSSKRYVALTLNFIGEVPSEIGYGQFVIDELFKDVKGVKVSSIEELFSSKNSPKIALNSSCRIPKDVYKAFNIISKAEEGVPIIIKGKEYPTRSEAEGYIVTQCLTAGISFEQTYSLFKYFNVGHFSTQTNKRAYLKNYYNNSWDMISRSPIRQELSRLNVNIKLEGDTKIVNNARLALRTILDFGVRYGTIEPHVSYRDIQLQGNMDRRSVKKAIDLLVENDVITKIKKKRHYNYKINLYCFPKTPYVSNTIYNNTKEYGVFGKQKLIYHLTKTQVFMLSFFNSTALNSLTQADLHRLTGYSRGTISKNCKILCEKGFLTAEGRLYSLLDMPPDALESGAKSFKQFEDRIYAERVESVRRRQEYAHRRNSRLDGIKHK